MKDLQNRIQQLLNEEKNHNRAVALITALSLLMMFIVPYVGVMPGAAMTENTVEYELICGIEEHTHTDECYTLICEDDSEEHEHTEECYELICGMEEHQHDDGCYAEIESFDYNNSYLKMSALGNTNILAAAGSSGFDGQRSSKSKPETREDNNNNLISATGGSSYFTSPVTEVGPNTKEVEDSEIQNITVSIGGNDYSAPDQDGNGVTVLLDEMSSDPIDASFSIRYLIEKDGDNYPVNVDSPCIYYQLPDGVTIPDEYFGRTRYVSDPNYNGPDGHISGYFSINENGLIVIQFTEDYIRNKIYQSDYFEGSINFDGKINRAKTQSGDREIMIGGLILQIPFTNQDSQLDKTNSVVNTETGIDINWAITVTNVANPAELSGCILDDPMFQNASVTVVPSDAGSFVNGQFVFADAANYASEITFTYTESLDADDINDRMLADNNPYSNQFVLDNNTATLYASDGTTELKHKDSTAYSNKPRIEKSGEESYKNGRWIKSTIYWTIDVTAPQGGNLNGYYITDDVLNQTLSQDNKLKTDGLTDDNGHKNSVVVMNGDTELTEGTHYTYDSSTGKITFNGDYESVSILYVTNCHDVEKDSENKRNVNNTVSLYHPDKDDTPLGTDSAYVPFDNSTFSYGKYASYNYDDNLITWEVSGTVLNPANANIYLNDPNVQFYLKDESFKTIGLDELALKSANWNNSIYDFVLDTTHANDSTPYLLIKSGDSVYGKVQYKSGTDDTLEIVDYEENTPYHLSAVAFNYTIDVSGTDAKPANGTSVTKDGMTITANEDGSIITYENSLGNGLSGDDYKGVIGEFNKTVRSTIGKSMTSVTGESSVLGRDTGWYYTDPENHNEPVYKQLSWTVNLVQDEGFAKDSVFTDTLKSADSSVQHVFDADMLDLQITLKTKENGGTVITGSNVSYTPSISGTTLTVTFDADYSAYKYATITYNSKAIVSQIKGSGDDWSTADNRFYNEAEYADHTASSSYSYQNKNPEYIEKFNLSLDKKWSDSDTTKRPDSIQFRLLRKSGSASATDEEKKWKYLSYDAATGNWIEHEEEGTLTDDSLYLFSAYRTKNYAYSFANLPKDTTAHDGDYEYKIVELPVEAYATSYQTGYAGFSGNHSYTITNTRENSIEKYVLDKDGNRLTNEMIALDNLELVTLNEDHYAEANEAGAKVNHSGQYYLISYEIDVDILDDYEYLLTDVIPSGTIFVHNVTESGSYEYQPSIDDIKQAIHFGYVHSFTGGGGYNNIHVEVSDASNEVKFTKLTKNNHRIMYYLAVSKEELETYVDGTVSLTKQYDNTATLSGMQPVTSSVIITKQKTDHEDNTLISKDVANSTATDDTTGESFYQATEQELRYRILVNPEGKKLAATNKSTYDINDILKINPKDVGVDIVSVTVKEVKITSPLATDANGRYIIDPSKYTVTDDEEPITYSYVSGDDSVTESDVSGEYLFLKKENTNDHVDYYETERHVTIPDNEVVYLTIKGKMRDEYKGSIDSSYSPINIIYQQYFTYGNQPVGETLKPTATSDYVKSYEYDPETGDYTLLVKLSNMPANTSDIKIERSDYRGAGITSVTVESATRYKTNDQGELVITVPDSKALLIEYTYKVDVKSGHINVTNEASIDTGSVSAWDKEDGTEFEVSQATAFSGASNEVKLVKRDINDYNLKIDADFYVAYYDAASGKWFFSSNTTNSTQGSGATAYTVNSFTFDKEADGNSIPSGAAKVSVHGINHIILDRQNAVYKFIEVPTTPGYLGTNIAFPVSYNGMTFNTFDELVNDYLTNEAERSADRNYPFRTFFQTYVPVHYFSYGTGTITKPPGVDSDLIKNVSVGDNLNIDNTKLLGVKAEKNWNGGTWPNGATALLKLYYSEKKITDGSFPESLKEASMDALGIQDSNFKATVSLNSGMQSYTWTNLPTSINDKRIYYYVREESYTIDGVNYRLQDDGSYTDGMEKGLYAPNYDGNGISRSDSDSSAVVTISNTSGLFLKKIWLDYYGGEIDGSSEELPQTIKVELKGKRATTGAEEKLYIVGSDAVDAEGIITLSAPDFMMELDGNVRLRNAPADSSEDEETAKSHTVKISDYSFFTLTEKDSDTAICWDTSVTPTNTAAKVSEVYRASSLSSVVNGKGQIAVANQKMKPTPISITANKEWVGGVPEGSPQIQLILYKTMDSTVTEENFETKLTSSDQVGEAITLPYNGKWSYTWSGLEKKDATSKQDYRYFVKEVKTGLTGYQAPTYDNQGRTGGGSMTVYNTPVPKAQLEVIKQWTDKDSSKRPAQVYVDLYRIAETPVNAGDSGGEPQAQTQSFKGTKENRLLSMSAVRRALAPESPAPMQLPRLSAIGIATLATASELTDSEGRTYYTDEIGNYYLFTIGQWGQWASFNLPVLDSTMSYSKIKVEGAVGDGTMYWGVPKYSWGGGQDTANALHTFSTSAGTYDVSNYQIDASYDQLVFSPVAQITDAGGVSIKVYFASSFQITLESNLTFDVDPSNAVKIGSSTVECDAVPHIAGVDDSNVSEYVTVTQNADKEFMMTVLKNPPGKISVTITDKSNSENTGSIDNITITPMQITPTNVSALSTSTDLITIPVTHTAGNAPQISGGDATVASCVYDNGNLVITPAGNASSPTAVSSTWTVSYGGVEIPVTFTANPAQLTAEITDGKTQFNIGEEFHVRTNKPAGFHLQKSETDSNPVDGLVQVGTPAQGDDGYYTYTFKVNGREDIDAAYLVAENTDDSNQNVGMPVSFKMVYTKQNVDAIENMTGEQQNNARIINNIPLVQDPNNPDRYICTDTATLARLAALPITDDNGNAYHYYIVEDETGLNGYVPWDYSGNNGSTLGANGKVTYTVYNGRNDEDSPSTTLPESGSTGTRIYYTLGAMLLLLAAAGYWAYSIKRRRWYDE
ncbi:MAG: Cna B-type domain-containing protein [Ruminococcus sp.]|uniref:Cna B-type domain-containing protein n=1 Tax=Ruminococcus sp. TaxID=41978 RepID=UPI0025EF3365|nr:Cna B-type domain-containing protein [Ruminococcus sp.]MCR5599656.1 Cna B-type domain-containing protein [Ruminococcus sp.]